MDRINLPYAYWARSQKALRILNDSLSGSALYEAKNILERYLMNSQNDKQYAINKARDELKEKKGKIRNIIPVEYALDILISQLEIIPVSLRIENKTILRVFPLGYHNTDVEFRYDINPEINPRIKKLLEIHPNAIDLAVLLLNYQSLLPGGQQWGVPYPVAKYLFDNDFRYEGFASPFNSRYLEFYTVREIRNGIHPYCSLFPSDASYGSMGNFFDTDLSIGSWLVNPPWVEEAIHLTAEKIIKFLNKGTDNKFFVILPNWTDASGYQMLVESPYLKEHQVLKRGTYYYQDPKNEIIPANFESAYFILSSGRSPPLSSNFLRGLINSWNIK